VIAIQYTVQYTVRCCGIFHMAAWPVQTTDWQGQRRGCKNIDLKKLLGFRFLILKKCFIGLTYEDGTQNYDPEVHEE